MSLFTPLRGLLLACVAGYTAWRAWQHAALQRTARWLALTLLLQLVTGVATIYLNFPLVIAVLHNAGAALLVLWLTMLNYQAKCQFALALATNAMAAAHTQHGRKDNTPS